MDLIDALEALRARLEKSGVERTAGFRTNIGPNCPYFLKSRAMFYQKDFADILPLLEQALSEYKKEMEGNDH